MPYIDNRKEINCVVNPNLGIDIREMDSNGYFQHFKLHWHENMELIYILDGSITASLNSTNIKNNIPKGNLIIIPPKKAHELWKGPNGTKSISFFIDLKSLVNQTLSTKAFFNSLIDERISFPWYTNAPEIISSVTDLKHLWDTNANSILINAATYRLLGAIFQISHDNTKISAPFKMQQILNYIHEHQDEEITSKTVSKEFGYTENYFCNLFKKHTNLSLSNYLRIMKIEKAKQLLQETDMDVSLIVEACNFNDFSYFCKTFKKYMKMTPLEFRKAFRNSKN